ncbi:MAG: 2-dehydro-3-deoxyphosphogluconate aldolase [Deltaproteobacteria bacterium]|nr:MAG: 2-dehydro-3-deoxyphosphogluconate aldolase [Deltaproteobacteria bacterium]
MPVPPDAFLARLWNERASAILRCDDPVTAKIAMEAAVEGGFRVIEFTMTIPGAPDLIAEFAARPDLVVGAGTVLRPDVVDAVVAAGASFVVSPVCDEAVIARCREHGVVAMPGCATPTELATAHRAGAQLQKLFPCPAGGPSFLRSVMGPMPFLRIVPTNGVDEHDVGQWLDAGAYAVGYVRTLFEPDALARRDAGRIAARARTLLAATRAPSRAQTPPVAPDPFEAGGTRPASGR